MDEDLKELYEELVFIKKIDTYDKEKKATEGINRLIDGCLTRIARREYIDDLTDSTC